MFDWLMGVLFWCAILALSLGMARRPSAAWLVFAGLYGVLLSVLLWSVPRDVGPANVWPLFTLAGLSIAAGLGWAVLRNDSGEDGRPAP